MLSLHVIKPKPHTLKTLLLTLSLILLITCAHAQYYLRGELKDEQGQGLPRVRITLWSKGNYPFYTGASGAFGIPLNVKVDSIMFTQAGYDTLKAAVTTTDVQSFTLIAQRKAAVIATEGLASVTKNFRPVIPETDDDESYFSTVENQIVDATSYPETSFGLHVERASYSNIRRYLDNKEKPPVDAVRIEEMLNYFNLKIEAADEQKETFTYNTQLTSCPWNEKNRLLFINVQARKVNLDRTPPANLVFLIDVSGSMDVPNRLPLLKSAFKLLTENLRSNDVVSIVTYGDAVTELLKPTKGSNKQLIIETIEGLRPNGPTPGASAIETAYRVARANFISKGNNRVILATDGDFNLGAATQKQLEELIAHERKAGIYLTCLGVGIGDNKDEKLEAFAKKGNGNCAYIDNEEQAEKVLVEEFAQTVYAVANNAYLNVKFNADVVKSYRLIGFDNKKSFLEDNSAALKGDDVGSGHSMLAAFEITPAAAMNAPSAKPVATLELSYKLPNQPNTTKEQYVAQQNFTPIERADNNNLRFASSVIMFGTLLKQSEYARDFGWDDLLQLATSSAKPGNLVHAEFVELIAKAKKLYPNKVRKKSMAVK